MRTLLLCVAVWLGSAQAFAIEAVRWRPPQPVEPDRLARFGLRVVDSEHARLITDLPPSPEIDRIPELIDQALPQWRARFGGAPDNWRMRLCLIGEQARFDAAGLMPEGRTNFPNGLALGYETWVRDQPTDYYRRHLVLHEATHSYMMTTLGGCGPGWFMEGLAELCGTHRADSQGLRLAAFPASREAAPMWGRVRLVRDAVEIRSPLATSAVRRIDNRSPLEPIGYAWVWALAKFLDDHPTYRRRFRELSREVLADDFEQSFLRSFGDDLGRLEQEWRLFAGTLTYGHDLRREAVDFRDGKSVVPGETVKHVVSAERGWQPSGVRVEAGRRYKIAARGRYVIARDPDGAPWPCEPGGVTIEYHRGRPLGELLVAVESGPDAFLEATPVGLRANFEPTASGTLYFRVNDAPNRLADNEGELTVALRVD